MSHSNSSPDYYRITIRNFITIKWNDEHCTEKSSPCIARYEMFPNSSSRQHYSFNYPNICFDSYRIKDKERRKEWESTLTALDTKSANKEVPFSRGKSDNPQVIRVPLAFWIVFHDYLVQHYQCVSWDFEQICGMHLTYEYQLEKQKSTGATLRRKWQGLKRHLGIGKAAREPIGGNIQNSSRQ